MLMNVQIENKKGNKTLTLENVVYIRLLDDGNYLIEYTNDNSRTNDYILDTTRYTIKSVWNSPFRKTDVLEAKWWTISKRTVE